MYYPTTKSCKLKLECIKNLDIRLALGYRNSTPNNILLSESKLFRIEQRTKLLASKFLLKSISLTDTLIYKKIQVSYLNYYNDRHIKQNLLLSTIKEIMCYKQYIHKEEYKSLYETNTATNIESIIDISIGKKLNDSQTFNINYDFNYHLNEETAFEIYTDGSKNRNQLVVLVIVLNF